MNVQQSAFLYLKKILDSVTPGVKVLVLDGDTLNFVSIALTKTELLENEVVLVEELKIRANKGDDPSTAAMNCIIFVRPSSENIQLIQAKKEKTKNHLSMNKYFL